jgi:hypothetical protein
MTAVISLVLWFGGAEGGRWIGFHRRPDKGGFGEEAQMRNRSRGARFASALAALMPATLQPGLIPAAHGAEAYPAAHTADGKPNLNGIWQALNTANWDIQEHAAQPGQVVALGAVGAIPAGLGVVEGDEIPYLPAAAARKKENFENRLTADPEIKCYLPGVPRATYMPYPFQIIQTPQYILIAYEYAAPPARSTWIRRPQALPIAGWGTRSATGRGILWSLTSRV